MLFCEKKILKSLYFPIVYVFLQELQEDARTNVKLKHEHQVALEKIKYQQAQIEMLNQVRLSAVIIH